MSSLPIGECHCLLRFMEGAKVDGEINSDIMFATPAKKLFIFLLKCSAALLFKEQRPAQEEFRWQRDGPLPSLHTDSWGLAPICRPGSVAKRCSGILQGSTVSRHHKRFKSFPMHILFPSTCDNILSSI